MPMNGAHGDERIKYDYEYRCAEHEYEYEQTRTTPFTRLGSLQGRATPVALISLRASIR